MTFIGSGKLDDRGRVYVGIAIRDVLKLKPGDTVLYYDGPEGIVYMVKPPSEIIKEDEFE